MIFKAQRFLVARFVLILTLLSGMFGAVPARTVHAATLTVTNTNGSGAGSLRQAIIDAAPGDTINFASSLAGQTIALSSQINLEKDLTIDGAGLTPAVEISGSLALRIFYVTSTVTLKSLLLKEGRDYSGSNGGAIFNDGNLTVTNSTFINNSTTGNGGAIYSRSSLNISNSTFVNNSAFSGGAIYMDGGIFTNPDSSRTILNNTFVSNQANAVNGQGGGIFSYGDGDIYGISKAVILANNTFSGNGAHIGGGLYSWGNLSITNNIFANSTSGGDCVRDMIGGTVNGSNNLIEDGSSCSTGSFVNGDPLLGPLSDNGGPTLTMALLPGSPAIDAGTAVCVSTDQRGVTRPQGAACEIGAYEYEYQPVIYHVKWNANGANNGISWADAFTSLQSALAVASSGDEIWVAAGTYKPTEGMDRTISFNLKSGVALYGGFAGMETSRSQRDVQTNVTILSGDLGITSDNSDDSYHIVIGSNTNNYAKLDGFTITGGNANGSVPPQDRGGGMYNYRGSPSLTNVIFIGNAATFGGGMYNGGESSYWEGSNPVLTNVTFMYNLATEGGGLRNDNYSSPRMMDVGFRWNRALRSGGGMENYNYSNPILTNATFNNNSASAGGGMMNWGSSSPSLINATFNANLASDMGGAIYNDSGSNPWLMYVTVSGNQAPQGGGMYNVYGSNPSATGSIFYGDQGGEIYDASGTQTIIYSIVQGGYPGTGNLDVDPLLGSLQDNGGLTQTMALGAGSPAIDAGDNFYCPSTDQRGISRPQGSRCDIGAYEYVAPPTPTPTNSPTLTKTNTPTLTSTFTPTPTNTTTPIPTLIFSPTPISAGETERVSVNSSGMEANNNSFGASISLDGRYVGLASNADNLVSGDTNGLSDAFIHDRQTGATIRVSVDSNGLQADNASYYPTISADGRYVTFYSFASNLVPGDTNGVADIFLRDLQTGMTTRISVNSGGVEGKLSSYDPSISADGRFIVFESFATNLVPGDTNGAYDIFLYNLQASTITRISVSSNGGQATAASNDGSISADGRYVTYHSSASNLVPGDTNGQQDIFLYDQQTGTTTLVSANSDGVQANGPSYNPSISGDGRFITFTSYATNLSSSVGVGSNIFVRDMQTDVVTLVTVDSNGIPANDWSYGPFISADGRYAAYTSYATNLVAGDSNAVPDAFIHDMQTGSTKRVSVGSNNIQGNEASGVSAISEDGSFILFDSSATNLVTGDTNLQGDVFVHRQDFLPSPTLTPTATPPYSYNPLYISLTGSQTIGGISSANEDILRFDGQNWSLFFDGSDVGLSSLNLFAFSIMDADTILMSFNNAVTLNGISFTPQDMARFDATSLGSTTAGTFSLYFDGSDVGFDTTSENIDSLSLLPDGRLLISTTGTPSVPGLTTGRDEDVLAFTSTSLGDVTSGTWSLYFDGSDVGLADSSNEDVDALDVTRNGNIYLSTLGDFAVNGLSGADEDVFVCVPSSIGLTTACNYSPTLYFDGSTWGLSGNDVDAFNFIVFTPPSTPPAITPTPNTPTLTATASPTPTATASPSPTPTFTGTPTSTPTATSTPPTSMFVQIVQPNGGEVLNVGTNYRITWNSTSDIDKVTIGYKACDSCLDWIANNIPNVGYYDWNVFVGNTINTQFKIYIIGYDTGVGSISDTSDNNFTVLQPTPTPTNTVMPTATQTPTQTPTRTNTPAATNSPTFTPTTGSGSTLTFAAVADTRVSQASPTTNYGTATTILVDGDSGAAQTGYIRFTANGISGSIQSAKLRVYCTTNGTANGPAAYLADSQWIESGTGGMTWNTQPALLSGAFDNKGAIGMDSWVEYDFTALVTGNNTYTFALVADSSDGITFSSREGTTPPQLVVALGPTSSTPTYTPSPSATFTGTPTATSVASPTNTGTATATTIASITPTSTSTFTPTPTSTPTSTPTLTTSSLTFLPVEDAYIASGSPTTNYGSATTLQVDNSPIKHFLIKFDVTGLNGGQVVSAKLRLYNVDPASKGGDFYAVNDTSWQEETLTWNNAPAALTNLIASLGSVSANNWYEIDITSLISGDGTYSLRISSTSSDGADYSSKEGANPPQLVITLH